MKAKAKKVVKAICFCLVVVLMVNFLTDLFKPKFLENRWKFTKTINSFYDLDEDNIEVALLGTSQMAASMDPLQLYEEQGISSFNLGIMSQPIQATYFWLREVVKSQDLKLAVVEVKAMARKGLKEDVKARRSFDYMKDNLNKLQYAKEYHNSLEDESKFGLKKKLLPFYWDYLFPLDVYHSRWSSLEYDDYDFLFGDNNRTNTRGFATLTTEFQNNKNYDEKKDEKGKYDGLVIKTDEVEDVHESIAEYDITFIEYAKEQGIPLLFIKTPDVTWNEKQHNYIKMLAEKYDIEFIDFNLKEMHEEIGFDLLTDEADTIHTNISGAQKITKYVGDYISANYDVTDYRESDSDVKEVIESELDDYHDTMRNANLSFEYDFYEYAELLDNEDYDILVVAGSNTIDLENMSDEQKDVFLKLGVKKDAFKETEDGVNVAVANINGEIESKADKQDEERTKSSYIGGSFRDGTDYAITAADKCCAVRINNNKQVLINEGALNVIVYDNKLHEIADTAYIYNSDVWLMIDRKEL